MLIVRKKNCCILQNNTYLKDFASEWMSQFHFKIKYFSGSSQLSLGNNYLLIIVSYSIRRKLQYISKMNVYKKWKKKISDIATEVKIRQMMNHIFFPKYIKIPVMLACYLEYLIKWLVVMSNLVQNFHFKIVFQENQIFI